MVESINHTLCVFVCVSIRKSDYKKIELFIECCRHISDHASYTGCLGK